MVTPALVIGMGPMRKFPKHPLDYLEPVAQNRCAKAMLANSGIHVGRVWVIDLDCIAFTTTHNRAMTAYITRDIGDEFWMLAPITVTGWPIGTD